MTCARRSLFLNNTRAIASVLFRNNARIRVANECVILDNAHVQVLILYKTRRTMECSDQQCNDVMISMICKPKVQLQLAFVTENDEEELK